MRLLGKFVDSGLGFIGSLVGVAIAFAFGWLIIAAVVSPIVVFAVLTLRAMGVRV